MYEGAKPKSVSGQSASSSSRDRAGYRSKSEEIVYRPPAGRADDDDDAGTGYLEVEPKDEEGEYEEVEVEEDEAVGYDDDDDEHMEDVEGDLEEGDVNLEVVSEAAPWAGVSKGKGKSLGGRIRTSPGGGLTLFTIAIYVCCVANQSHVCDLN